MHTPEQTHPRHRFRVDNVEQAAVVDRVFE